MFGIKKLIWNIGMLRQEYEDLRHLVDMTRAECQSTNRMVINYFTKFRTPTKIDGDCQAFIASCGIGILSTFSTSRSTVLWRASSSRPSTAFLPGEGVRSSFNSTVSCPCSRAALKAQTGHIALSSSGNSVPQTGQARLACVATVSSSPLGSYSI